MTSGLIAEMAAAHDPLTSLLHAPDRKPLTRGECLGLIERTVAALRDRGIAPDDRVAVVLPNGPELALAFLAISSAAIFAPLNPQYSQVEFAFFLQDLGARVLITEPGFCPAAVQAAEEARIPVFGLCARKDHAAGEFVLEGAAVGEPVPAGRCAGREATALLLHSSGTTARPKLIPLTHANLCESAENIARTLALGEHDVCLNVMPLFHIHGLVGAFLASLAGGASVFCAGGFNAFRFTRLMLDSKATWCTAVPTMYQAILARTEGVPPDQLQRFRMLRSSSAHLHAPVWKRLEEVFACPVLNSYGMTEASHQMASNLLPPEQRRIGTVGRAAGPEMAVMNEDGALVEPGCRGEIVIRGRAVTSGYLSPQTAKAGAFRNGWFRTGDEGSFDADGYLTLIGRLKEIINVGGEKVAPAEIDEVLMQHPAVAQAVAFGVPCRIMGERVYAAVVLQSQVGEAELRTFARERLARFKIPEKILSVDSIPKGATGKVQRLGMAARLGIEEL
jgi:acyl-CoA synthetase (AMP-forming)/AMP-acid ligase II